MHVFYQDPNAVVRYTVNWAEALPGDTISGTPTWVNPDAVTTSSAANTTTTHSITVSAVAANTPYRLTSRVVSAAGLTHDYTFLIIGKER
jgi:hypothetical protein